MPIVPERPLSYGEILEKRRKQRNIKHSPPSKAFAEVDYVPSTKNSPTGYIKRYKLKDKALISEQIAHQDHIRGIKNEI